MDWAEERARRAIDEMLEYVRLRAAPGVKRKADYGVAHTFIAQALREAEARGAERRTPAEQRSPPQQVLERTEPAALIDRLRDTL